MWGWMTATRSSYNNPGGSSQGISSELRSRDLPSKRLLGKGLASIGYETELDGERFARIDFIGAPSGTFQKEATILAGLKDHKNVVRAYGWIVDKMSCSLILEYMEDDLLGLLQKRKESQGSPAGTDSGNQSELSRSQPFELPEALDIILQIARGMECLHEQNILHGDLKTKNILVTRMKEEERNLLLVKVADYGLVRTKRKSMSFVSRQARKLDVVQWKAPENLERLLSEDKNETSSESDSNSDDECTGSPAVTDSLLLGGDVYSFAVTCVQILTGEDPYPNLNWKEMGARIVSGALRPKLPAACPPLLNKLLVSCWGNAPAQRPTFSNIRTTLEHLHNRQTHTTQDIQTISSAATRKASTNNTWNSSTNAGLVTVPQELKLWDGGTTKVIKMPHGRDSSFSIQCPGKEDTLNFPDPVHSSSQKFKGASGNDKGVASDSKDTDADSIVKRSMRSILGMKKRSMSKNTNEDLSSEGDMRGDMTLSEHSGFSGFSTVSRDIPVDISSQKLKGASGNDKGAASDSKDTDADSIVKRSMWRILGLKKRSTSKNSNKTSSFEGGSMKRQSTPSKNSKAISSSEGDTTLSENSGFSGFSSSLDGSTELELYHGALRMNSQLPRAIASRGALDVDIHWPLEPLRLETIDTETDTKPQSQLVGVSGDSSFSSFFSARDELDSSSPSQSSKQNSKNSWWKNLTKVRPKSRKGRGSKPDDVPNDKDPLFQRGSDSYDPNDTSPSLSFHMESDEKNFKALGLHQDNVTTKSGSILAYERSQSSRQDSSNVKGLVYDPQKFKFASPSHFLNTIPERQGLDRPQLD